jgi:DNA primase
MFPIADARGRVIAFGGRALEKDVPAKYLNSPETSLFHKGATLYNIAAARAAAHKVSGLIVAEGYVDVIALVAAGFPGAVAPLGTALTQEQLALLWRMTDEPVLCFDGDDAGRRAAYRAVDLALPALKPGKSLKFATLPQGQDPDDLIRSGGRAAMEEVLAGARPLADMLWLRETEAGGLDTPERRAALEARIDAVTRAVGDDAVRKYYRQDFQARLEQMFAPQPTVAARRGPGNGQPWPSRWNGPDRRSRFGDRARNGGSDPRRAGPYVAVSPQLATSPVHRGHSAAIPRREALILQVVGNHPWLLHDHLEDFTHLEFRHGDAHKLKSAVIDVFAHDAAVDRQGLRAAIAARGFEPLLQRIERTITTASVWAAQPEAAPDDVLMTWRQLIALHRQWHSLIKELKDAEYALGQESSEENYSWLCDVKARLSDIDGTEASIEGFGVSSGRAVGGV